MSDDSTQRDREIAIDLLLFDDLDDLDDHTTAPF